MNLKLNVSLAALMAIWAPTSSPALTASLARKCDAMTAKAYPPRISGNPAAGSAAGSGREQQAFYKKCVASNGSKPKDNPTK
jgi:hypothetical protein